MNFGNRFKTWLYLALLTRSESKSFHLRKTCVNLRDRIFDRTGLDEKLTAVKMMFLDRREAEEFYEVYRNVVPEYSQMVCNELEQFYK